MKPTILLTGKTGQIGSALLHSLSSIGEVVAPARLDLDLLDSENLRRVVRDIRPQIIVNAAAYTAVDAAETKEAMAHAVNAAAPAVLAEEAKKVGALIVHYSTDYVFDGLKSSPYEETDAPLPLNVYGKTKLAGEQAIRDSGAHHLIFRTAWVYSTRGRNFLWTILRLATEREELRIVQDQTGSPTWSREIALSTTGILAQIVGQNRASSGFSEVSGTYHMTATGETTWFGFANAILEEAAQLSTGSSWFAEATGGKPLVARRIVPIFTAEYPTPASRPTYSVLSNSRLIQKFGCALPDWRTQLRLAFASDSVAQHASISS
jgi:dTDP-4-dehydrorhamnose reductase